MLHAIAEHGIEREDEDAMQSKGVLPVISGGRRSNALAEHPALRLIRTKLADPASMPAVAIESWKDLNAAPAKRVARRAREEEDNRSLQGEYALDLKRANKTIAALRSENRALTEDLQKLEERYDRLKARRGSRHHRNDSP